MSALPNSEKLSVDVKSSVQSGKSSAYTINSKCGEHGDISVGNSYLNGDTGCPGDLWLESLSHAETPEVGRADPELNNSKLLN